MRQFIFFTALFWGLLPAMAVAQQNCAAPPYVQPNCAAPSYSPPAQTPTAPARNFLRPPGTGQAMGESNSIGVRGPMLHIPEMKIGLPMLELPSFARLRRDAEMIFDNSRGPLVSGEVQEFGSMGEPPVTPAAAPVAPSCVAPAPAAAPACAAPGAPVGENAVETIHDKLARLDRLEREIAFLRAACTRDTGALPANSRQTSQPDSVQTAPSTNSSKGGSINSAAAARGLRPVSRGSCPMSQSEVIQARHQDAVEQEDPDKNKDVDIAPSRPERDVAEVAYQVPSSALPVAATNYQGSLAGKLASKLRLRK